MFLRIIKSCLLFVILALFCNAVIITSASQVWATDNGGTDFIERLKQFGALLGENDKDFFPDLSLPEGFSFDDPIEDLFDQFSIGLIDLSQLPEAIDADALIAQIFGNKVDPVNSEVQDDVDAAQEKADAAQGKSESATAKAVVSTPPPVITEQAPSKNKQSSAKISLLPAGCQPKATPKGDVIVCTGTDLYGVDAGRGDDDVTVEAGATVSSIAMDPPVTSQPQTTTIDGAEDDDTIINYGTVAATAISAGNLLKLSPSNGSDDDSSEENDQEEKKGALAIAIQGSEGEDTIINEDTGTVTATAVTTATDIDVSVSSAKVDVGASEAVAEAIGVDGGSEDDTLENYGDVTATATATSLKSEVATNKGRSTSDDAATSIATTTGMIGGEGNDTIINEGTITAVSTAVVSVFSGTGGTTTVFSAAGDHKAEATSTGLTTGDGDDIITNTGDITAVSTAVNNAITIDIPANGSSKAVSTAQSITNATAVITGEGNDTLTNSGALTAVATSEATAQSSRVAKSGKSSISPSTFGGKTSAESTAMGVDTGAGTDEITNSGSIAAVATSVTYSGVASISTKEQATADTTSLAKAVTTGIDLGNDSDTLDNTGEIAAVSTATAATVEFAFSDEKDANAAKKGMSKNGAEAEAVALGISGDGTEGTTESEKDLKDLPHEITATASYSKLAAQGDNTITNSNTINAVATAVSGAGSVGVSVKGAASADAYSKATSNAKAVDAGMGNDKVYNFGDIAAVSSAAANSLGFSFSESKNGKVKVGATSNAEATGLSADGIPSSTIIGTELVLSLVDGIYERTYLAKIGASGNDIVTNDGAIIAVATAESGSAAIAVSVKDASSAKAKAAATANAKAIDLGMGDDKLTSTGEITAVSTALANSIGFSFSDSEKKKAKGKASAGASSDATATGLSADGMPSSFIAETELSINLIDGLNSRSSVAKIAATGNDNITNSGAITAVATAESGSAALAVSMKNASSASAKATATSSALGVDLGGGNDILTSTGPITAVASSIAGAVEFAYSNDKDAGTTTGFFTEAFLSNGVTADAQAIGIRGDGTATSYLAETSLHIWLDGIDEMFHFEKAGSTGNDTITNDKSVTSVATAVAGEASVSVSTKGAAKADALAKATAKATGIDAGDGNDSVVNNGVIAAVSTATAFTLEGAFSSKDAVSSRNWFDMMFIEQGAHADARSIGVKGDGDYFSQYFDQVISINLDGLHTGIRYEDAASGGTDYINNSEEITAVATAVSGSGSVAVSIEGDAKADAISKATAKAKAVDGGMGNDEIINSGAITAVATATAASAGFSYSGNKDVKKGSSGTVSVNAESMAEAIGITADGIPASDVFETTFDLSLEGLDTSTRLEGIAASGNDIIDNTGDVTAVATATSVSGALAVTTTGSNTASAKAIARSKAIGIDAGTGDDTITNTGNVTAVSTATAGAVEVSFSKEKSAGTETSFLKKLFTENGSLAEAEAIGIRADGTDNSSATELALHMDFDDITQTFHHETLGSTGIDDITNSGNVISVATATSGQLSASVAADYVWVEGSAKAEATSKANSRALGIEAGDGDDTVDNSGEVTAVSTATALALAATFSKGGSSDTSPNWLAKKIVDYGAHADAEAVGIKGDGDYASHYVDQFFTISADGIQTGASYEYAASSGTDIIDNTEEGSVTAVATAVSGSASISASAEGTASADSTSKAKSTATAINAGAGDDTVTNAAELTAVSTATAGALGISLTQSKGGKANAAASAESEAIGISGDGNLNSGLIAAALDVDLEGLHTLAGFEITSATGIDEITNHGTVTAVSTAVSGAGSIAVSLEGAASTDMSSTAKATAIAIDAGSGDDIVANHGTLTAVSTATAAAFSAGVAGKGGSLWEDFKSVFVGGTKAEATAKGLTGDSTGKDFSSWTELDVSFTDLDVRLDSNTSLVQAGGVDDITNTGLITATAVATAPVADVKIALDGKATAVSTAEAESKAVGIDAGTAGDTVFNSGDVVATAVATAAAVNIAVSKSVAFAADTIFKGSTEATAEAVGISGDGEGRDWNGSGYIEVTNEAVRLGTELSTTVVSGDDEITNEGAVVATAVSSVPSLGVAVSLDSAGAAVSTAEAEAKAKGIDAGAGNDIVDNSGDIVATSVATAAVMNIAVNKGAALAGNSLWNGGTEARSEAIGISGDGEGRDWTATGIIEVTDEAVHLGTELATTVVSGEDDITSTGPVIATSVATAPTAAITVSVDSVGAALATASAKSKAVGIDAGAGIDTVLSSDEVVATSVATAAAMNIAVTKKASMVGSSLWDGATTAESEAVGISGDGKGRDWTAIGDILVADGDVWLSTELNSFIAGDNDNLTNNGTIAATSVATVPSLGVSVSVEGTAGAVAKAEAESRAVGIDAGTGDDTVLSNGELVATSVATAVDLNVAVSKSFSLAGGGLWDGATTATSEAVGISGDGKGQDYMAIGNLSVVDGDVHLDAFLSSTKVSGVDHITNNETIVSTSIATAASAAVAVSVNGGSASLATAEADALAVGIDAGAGNDIVLSTGEIIATADATAVTGNVAIAKGFAVAGGGLWDGGAKANSEAIGISGDGEGRDYTAEGLIEVSEGDVLLETELSSTVVSGEDTLTNDGTIVATSVAAAPTLDVAVAVKGFAMAASKSTGESRAVGIDGGAGDDTESNTGTIVATSVANADAITVAVTPSGVTSAGGAFWDGGVSATSEAVGMSGDGKGQDYHASGSIAVIEREADPDKSDVHLSTELSSTMANGIDTITNDGTIVATSVAAAPSLGVSVAVKGVAASSASAEAESKSVGIDGGSGNDDITSTDEIVSTSVASANAISASIAVGGLTVSMDSFDGGTTAESEAIGISGDGEGRDWFASGSVDVTDEGVLIEGEASTSVVSGDDIINNEGKIVATSVAEALSAAVAVSVKGVGVSSAKSTANSRSVAIDAGAGDDQNEKVTDFGEIIKGVTNTGELVSTSVANANAVSVSVTPAGAAASFDGGTSANSEAIGISGDGKGRDWSISGSIEIIHEDEEFGFTPSTTISTEMSSLMVSGDDFIDNDGDITATSVAASPSVGVSVAVYGVAGAISSTTAESTAMCIDGGAGGDEIENSGELVATSVANADAVSVTVVVGGVGLAAGGFWDGGTTAVSEAVGISGDGFDSDLNATGSIEINEEAVRVGSELSSTMAGGDDTITNDETIVATSVAFAPTVDVGVTVAGVAGAVTAATAESRAAAIDGGAGGDVIDNKGELVSTSVGVALTVPVAVAPAGVSIAANSFWDGGATATSEAIGISGDGQGSDWFAGGHVEITEDTVSLDSQLSSSMVSGDDIIDNDGKIVTTSVAEAPAVAVAVTVFGVSAAVASAESDSRAVAIDGGSGGDTINNKVSGGQDSGLLVATSVANTINVNVGVTPGGVTLAGNGAFDGGTTAISEAVGISGDGQGSDWSATGSIDVAWGDEDPTLPTYIDDLGTTEDSATVTSDSADFSALTVGQNFTIYSGPDADTYTVASIIDEDTITLNRTLTSNRTGIAFNTDGDSPPLAASVSVGSGFSSTMVSGDDTIYSEGEIVATSVAMAPSVAVGVAVGGVAGAISSATAESRAAAIDGGAGGDTITNKVISGVPDSGKLVATSVANANAVNVAVGVFGIGLAGNGAWDGGTTAVSEAIGISGDGEGQNYLMDNYINVIGDEVMIGSSLDVESVHGVDVINSEGEIVATSVAVAPTVAVGVSVIGVAGAISTTTAESRAAGIDAGAGGDKVTNSGELVATSVANADTIDVAVGLLGGAVAASGATASSEAVGISGDGKGRDEYIEGTIAVTDDFVSLGALYDRDAATGDDTIINDGKITATSVAVAPSAAVAVNLLGVAGALTSAEARSNALGIDAGAGDDTVTNRSELEATSVATAVGVAVSVSGTASGAGNSFWDGGVTAESNAIGISGDSIDRNETMSSTILSDRSVGGSVEFNTLWSNEAVSGNDTIDNYDKITAVAVAVAPAYTASVGAAGISSAVSTATAEATAVAIDGGGGNDNVDDKGISNSGELVATAVANADTINISTSMVGVSVAANSIWDGGTESTAKAFGISGDSVHPDEIYEGSVMVTNESTLLSGSYTKTAANGNDIISNSGKITSTSVSVAPSITQSTSMIGVSAAVSTSTSEAIAAGIEAGGGDDKVTNTADLDAVAVGNADAINLSIGLIGVTGATDSVWDGGTTATAEAVGISGDRVGKDELTEYSVEVDGDGVLLSELTTGSASSGNDTINNSGNINATSVVVAPSVSVSFGIVGVSAALSAATAESRAVAIDAGDGNDTEVTNTGKLSAISVANADAVSVAAELVGVSGAGNAAWDGGTTARAEAVGMSGDSYDTDSTLRTIEITADGVTVMEEKVREATGGDDIISNSNEIEAKATAVTVSADVALTGVGIAAAVSTSTAESHAAAIDAGGGSDTVTNTGDLIVDSDAVAVAVAVGIAPIGLSGATDAVWDGGTTAEAEAVGIGGDGSGEKETMTKTIQVDGDGVDIEADTIYENLGGNDHITNEAVINVSADANSTSVGVSAVVVGVASASSTGTARAQAAAVDASGGNDTVDNKESIAAYANAEANTVETSVGLVGVTADIYDVLGVDIDETELEEVAELAETEWDSGTTAEATAGGILGGVGNDIITNQASVMADSTAKTSATGVSANLFGAAGAIVSAHADAKSTAIGGGAGDDEIKNSGSLFSIADADAVGTSVGLTIVGFAGAESSSSAYAEAIGIETGAGEDKVCNAGNIEATADADATAVDVKATIVGASMSFGSETFAESFAAGIVGTEGTDTLTNDALITLDSDAGIVKPSVSVSVTLTGYSKANVSSTAIADASGLAGGDDNDNLANRGTISALVDAVAPTTAVGVTMIGATHADASSTAEAYVTGMEGGSGNDEIVNAGMIDLDLTADASSSAVAVTVMGAAGADTDATAVSSGVGLDGGSGNDEIHNIGTTDVKSTATTPVDGTTVVLFGAGDQKIGSAATARAAGADLGIGDDFIGNTGLLKAKAVTDNEVKGVTFILIGASTGQGMANADAEAVGVKGDNGEDIIFNYDEIDVDAVTTIDSSGTVGGLLGSSEADATINGSGIATGVSGGNHNDQIFNAGTVDVFADITATSTGSSWTLAGAAGTDIGMTTDVNAIGLDGGSGNDLISNTGNLIVASDTTSTFNSSSWTLAGVSGDSGSLVSSGEATGIMGGGGNDDIYNVDTVDVDVTASLSASGGSDAIFGKSSSKPELSADAEATGVNAGNHNDLIANLASIDVDAVATLTSSSVAFSFIGSATAEASLDAVSKATGIHSGAGNDEILNEDSLTVDATANLTASGGAKTFFTVANKPESTVNVYAEVEAIGIDAYTGSDDIFNYGNIEATSQANPTSTNDVSVGGLFVGGKAKSEVSAETTAIAADMYSGSNTFYNEGTVKATAKGTVKATSKASGEFLSAFNHAYANADVTIETIEAKGIVGLNGVNEIANEAGHTLEVKASPFATAKAEANGKAAVEGFATATATAEANGAEALGITLGNGNNKVRNSGTMTVTATPRAKGHAISDASGIGVGQQPDSTANATAKVNDALAIGINTGSGDNRILNEGTMNVTSFPRADLADADGKSDGFEVGIDSFAYSYAYANNAEAYGVKTGDGENKIWNTGSITVKSKPKAIADSDANGKGWDGDATAKSYAYVENALAVGIHTGSDDDEIWNDGTIFVEFSPIATATSDATGGCQGGWDACNDGEEDDDTHVSSTSGWQTIGIDSGGGDDLVVNNGTITTSLSDGFLIGAGVGVDTGNGDDILALTDGSRVDGFIYLGAGEDILNLSGSPVTTAFFTPNGQIDGGAGTDTAILYGGGTYNGWLVNFEGALKLDPGTYTIPSPPTFEILEVVEGTLVIEGDYTFDDDGTYVPHIDPDGSCPPLEITGTATIAGDVQLVADEGAFVDGTDYDLLLAKGLDGDFDKLDLPDTPILTFSPQKDDGSMGVEVDVESFKTQAKNSQEEAIAEYLDKLTAQATGNLGDAIGKFQRLSEEEFNNAFASVNPDQYASSAKGYIESSKLSFKALQDRLDNIRNSVAFAPLTNSKTDAAASFTGIPGASEKPLGLWHEGAKLYYYEEMPGVSNLMLGSGDFASIGFDQAIGSNFVFGYGKDYSELSGDLGFAGGDGTISGNKHFVYGSYSMDAFYMDTALFYGNEEYSHSRGNSIGSSRGSFSSDHDSKSFSSYVETGRLFTSGSIILQPFASLEYMYLKEESFTESGGGAMSLKLDDVAHDMLVSNLGIRTTKLWMLDNLTIMPEFSLAWRYYMEPGDFSKRASFVSAPDEYFTIDGDRNAYHALDLGASLKFMDQDNMSINLDFNGEMLTDEDRYEAMWKLEYKF